jgi:hypothetical protein
VNNYLICNPDKQHRDQGHRVRKRMKSKKPEAEAPPHPVEKGVNPSERWSENYLTRQQIRQERVSWASGRGVSISS